MPTLARIPTGSLQADLWALYEQKLALATASDKQQSSKQQFRKSSMVDARGGSAGYYWG